MLVLAATLPSPSTRSYQWAGSSSQRMFSGSSIRAPVIAVSTSHPSFTSTIRSMPGPTALRTELTRS